jgi:hypothetical protein
MRTIYRVLLSMAVVGIALAMSGCSAIGQLLASATPTPTNTATITPTSTNTATHTNTPTPTATPKPPLGASGCAKDQDCITADRVSAYLPGGKEPEAGSSYSLTIPASHQLRFQWSWCAKDQMALASSIKNYEFVFTIDGVPYPGLLKQEGTDLKDGQDPKLTHPCITSGAFLWGWKAGESHTITIGGRVTAATSDGWDNYQPGEQVTRYVVNPIDVTDTPTPTPTKTATRTPTRTNTPLPLPTSTPIPYVPPTPECGEKGTIDLDNETNGVVTIYLKGPANYTYNLPVGDNKFQVCGGSYSFTAYGCGGASVSGKIGTSQDTYYKFSCR